MRALSSAFGGFPRNVRAYEPAVEGAIPARRRMHVSSYTVRVLELCPRCGKSIDVRAAEIECLSCGARYPRLGSIPILLRDPAIYLDSCRTQLHHMEQQSARTIRAIEGQLQTQDLMPATKE